MLTLLTMNNGATVLKADVLVSAFGGRQAAEGTVLAQHPFKPEEYVIWTVWRDADTGDGWEAVHGAYVGESWSDATAEYDRRRGVTAPF